MPTPLVLKSSGNNEQVYSLSTDPDLTVRFKHTENKKVLNGVSVTNYVTDVIINDANDVTVSGVSANDALSIRLRVSGTKESAARIATLLSMLSSGVTTWPGQAVFVGFQPTTVPTLP